MNPQKDTEIANPQTKSTTGFNGLIRPYINDNLNSRVNTKLPEGLWKLKWKSPVLKGSNPAFVLQSGNRIVVQGTQTWQLFDMNGKQIATNNFGNSDVVIDPSNQLLYCTDRNSFLQAYNLNDGELSFILDDVYGVNYSRPFITRIDNTFFVLSNEQVVDPHSSEKPEITYIEAQNIGKNPEVDYLKILTASKRENLQKRKSGEAISAANRDKIVLAYNDHIEYLDKNLNVLTTYKDKFIPLAMSLDENSKVHIIVKNENQDNFLWILDSIGNKKYEFPLKPYEQYMPPVIGFDNKVYVYLNNQIVAFLPPTGILWEQFTSKIHGMVILADTFLLVSEDKYIFAFDNNGERKFIFDSQELPLTTPPFITEEGEIIVADKNLLYCLTTGESFPGEK